MAAHFLVSMVLVAIATTLWLRSREPGVGQPLVRRPFILLVGGISAATAVVLTIGTVVTGSGPHSGDPAAGRTGFDPELVSQLHADVVFLLIGLTVALLAALYAIDSPARVRRAARDLLIVQLAQGVVGYVQYFTDLPIALVLVHMLGAVLITAFTARLVWSLRGPASEVPLGSVRSDSPPALPARQPAEACPLGPVPVIVVLVVPAESAARCSRRPPRPPASGRGARSGRPTEARPADRPTSALDERLDLQRLDGLRSGRRR